MCSEAGWLHPKTMQSQFVVSQAFALEIGSFINQQNLYGFLVMNIIMIKIN